MNTTHKSTIRKISWHRLALVILTAASVFLLWTGLILFGLLKGWGRSPIAAPGDTRAFFEAAAARIESESNGNAAFTLIESGNVFAEHFSSVGEPVDKNSLFQVASLSKWISAWGVMTLVESGEIDLDAPVTDYLTRWTLPEGKYDSEEVTVRRLLSHTAGLTDGLGYMGFESASDIQTLEASLTRAADAAPLLRGSVIIGAKPGSQWRYSGGGYTLLQLMIEEVSGLSFNDYMKSAVFDPLGMSQSTFIAADDHPGLAEFYDIDSSSAPHRHYTAKAAASLYTTPADLTLFLQAHQQGAAGEPTGRGVLAPQTLELMRAPVGFVRRVPIWGLGTILYAPNAEGGHIIGHDGDNFPAIQTSARLDPATGDGFILLVTGHKALASDLGDEWIFWRSGKMSPLSLNMMDLRTLAMMLSRGPTWKDVPALLLWLFGAGLILWNALRLAHERRNTASASKASVLE